MTESEKAPYAVKYDLTNCAAEPIQYIRHYQRPAFLLVVDPHTLTIKAHSNNFPGFSDGQDVIIGKALSHVLSDEDVITIKQILGERNFQVHNPIKLKYLGAVGDMEGVNLVLNSSGDDILLEFEPRDEKLSSSAFLLRVDQALNYIQTTGLTENLYDKVVKEVKILTEYDRVMLYRFDSAYNGEVIAEARNKELEPFLHLRYPHTDIPEQARNLFLKNPVRHIVNANPSAVSLVISDPSDGEVDLSQSANRGSSPIHLQYLNNMGVGATLNIALVVNQKLWGLISCHHYSPKMMDYRLRSIISLMGKVLSGHVALGETADFRNRVLGTSITRSKIFERMSERYDIVDGLMNLESPTLTDLAAASGAAILIDGEVYKIGETPNDSQILEITDFLATQTASIYATDRFFEMLPAARNFTQPPAGLLSIRLSSEPGEYILWFRPEVTKTIQWGGRPDQRKQILDGRVGLHPEISFMKWEEELAGTSVAWEPHQFDAATGLRNDIKEVILQNFQEARKLNGQLLDAYQELETYSYTVSHDLKAPLRNIKGFAEILQEDYYDQLDDFGREALDTIVSSVGKMNSFINDILAFSSQSKSNVTLLEVQLDSVIDEVWNELKLQAGEASFQREGGGIVLLGDFIQLKQLVQNILSNALKYSSKVLQPKVSVRSRVEKGNAIIEISDNGIGLDMKHAQRIFTVFNRLVSEDDYEGSGVGLAIAKSIVEKHHGEISVSSEPGAGTTFTITIPSVPLGILVKK